MKLSMRRTVLGLVAALSLGFAFPLASPASAGSCSELSGITGSTSRATYDRLSGGITINVADSVNTSAAGCSTSWMYTLTLVTQDKTTRSQTQAAYGTDRTGSATFAPFTSSLLPKGTTEVAFDHKSFAKDRAGFWVEQSARRFVVTVPDLSYDSAAGRNAYPVDSCPVSPFQSAALNGGKIPVGYNPWC